MFALDRVRILDKKISAEFKKVWVEWYDPKISLANRTSREWASDGVGEARQTPPAREQSVCLCIGWTSVVLCLVAYYFMFAVRYGIFMVPTWHIAQRLGTLTYFIAICQPQTTVRAMFPVVNITKMMTGRRIDSSLPFLPCAHEFQLFIFFFSFSCRWSRIPCDTQDTCWCGVHTFVFLSLASPFRCVNFGCDCKTGVKMSCWHIFLRLHSINLFWFSF